MLDPAALSPAHARITQTPLTEDAFLARAYAQLRDKSVGCLLDSAGPVMVRAERSFLCETVRGIFLQSGNEVVFDDVATGNRHRLNTATFAAWVETFHNAGYAPGGPMLFPMLTYEAFNPFGAPRAPHPLWRAADAVWLLAETTAVYDRASGVMTRGQTDGDHPFNLQALNVPQAKPGWRESEREYSQKIKLVQRDIYDGIYYQANLSQRFLAKSPSQPLATYQKLRALNPSPFMGIFRYGDLWVLSGSPERLVDKVGEAISARPIAGTKPRLKDPIRDAASQEELISSEKERAEHLMLVDLIRNDLGRVAVWGSVRVRELYTIESYSHVHHLVSQVEAKLRDGVSLFDLIASMFPGGTITGAPKISCIQRLVQLEGEARGPYTGSMGYVAGDGTMDLNILIRTLIQHRDQVCFHGGGGIVADSKDTAEYQETRQKCLALMEALGIQC